MMDFGGAPQRSGLWSWFRPFIAQKSLSVQFSEDVSCYFVYGYDLPEVLSCTIWKGDVPSTVIDGYSQAQNDADRAEFEARYKANANGPIMPRQGDGLPQYAIAPTTGSEIIVASHNLCDRCSWFGDSVRAHDEALTDHGDGVTFDSAHTHWIDTTSGRFYGDDDASALQKATNPGDPHGYLVVVKVSGVELVMRAPFETQGGDYEVFWETGQVHFFAPPAAPPVVSYSYASGSTFYVKPTPGKVLRILRAEVDVSLDCVMTDAVVYTIFALVDAVAPQLVAGGMVPSGTSIPIGEVVYKRMGQIAAEAQGAYPAIEVLGATDAERALSLDVFRRTSRGTRTRVQALPFNYNTTRDLSSAAQMAVHVHTAHDRAFEGDSVTVTFYCVSKDEV
jgi:hypothetical protein